MNNPVRPLFQRHLEARQLRTMGGDQPRARVLEVGCGNGAGIDLLFDMFGVDRVHGFDIDERVVNLARAKHRHRSEKVKIWVGDVANIPAEDAAYDAVFDFGVLHHTIDWRAALQEIHRVLKPGGRIYIEEITRKFIVHPIWRTLLDHPQEDRFDLHDLTGALETAGFRIVRSREFGNLFIWCVADRC